MEPENSVLKGSVLRLWAMVNEDGCSFTLKGQHKPARRNAADNGLNDDF
ncbi:MAG: hypothetical protein LBG58_12695 [Planctomycetaceae bacterium]|jgi:hypothetical protein|nr:hypothetical protein [Planctomycetaceae bacterium]